MQCPLCRDEVLEPHVRNGVEVDRCSRCRGIWLDRGEIDKLVAGPTAGPTRSPDRPTGRPAGDRGPAGERRSQDPDRRSKKKKRKKGFADRLADVLEELID